MDNVISNFRISGSQVSCERYGFGHINQTYLSVSDTGARYILQRINRLVFPDVDGLMRNITAVTEFTRARTDDPRGSMEVVPTLDGKSYYTDAEGGCWRVYKFVEHSLCLQTAETKDEFYESAVAFGRFQQMLESFPAETLTETIRDFHNTPERYAQLREAVEKDLAHRVSEVGPELQKAWEHEKEAGVLNSMRRSGQLPVRVTHNDAKLNNVLLDEKTKKALCVIDLDTVMPGLVVYDFGDSIRFGASTAAEDETDLTKVGIDLDLFRVYTRGFVRSCPGLTEAELLMLPMGAKLMTLENGVRFLADHINGDVYFAVHRPGHNLDRARAQFKLVEDMEKKWGEMNRIVREESGR